MLSTRVIGLPPSASIFFFSFWKMTIVRTYITQLTSLQTQEAYIQVGPALSEYLCFNLNWPQTLLCFSACQIWKLKSKDFHLVLLFFELGGRYLDPKMFSKLGKKFSKERHFDGQNSWKENEEEVGRQGRISKIRSGTHQTIFSGSAPAELPLLFSRFWFTGWSRLIRKETKYRLVPVNNKQYQVKFFPINWISN